MSNPDSMIDDSSTISGSKSLEEDIEEKIDCPLFMDGLPNDFQSNPQLAAIASLLDDEETSTKEEDEKSPQDVHTNPQEPSKARGNEARAKSRSLRRIAISSPYQPPPTKKSSTAKTASMGETQLFLKMWKLS